MVETLDPTIGRMAVVVTLGVLFRGGAERHIRELLLQENLIDSVIALPPKMFAHTGIPVALLLLRKNKADQNVLFIDASHSYQHGKTQNVLQPEDLDDIELAYRARKDEGRYARLVTHDEIAANDYNLTIARYVEALDEETEVDLVAVRQERARLEAELAELQAKLSTLLREVPHA